MKCEANKKGGGRGGGVKSVTVLNFLLHHYSNCQSGETKLTKDCKMHFVCRLKEGKTLSLNC
jgi:hypothetical protein